ncbi:MAG: TrmH family RNA methyltransferase [Bacteroidia bacterium]|jgi:tRNA G18 (ribose-2'-O)-methylase SpoU|nr:TrmH family RNA methyltransferase [Bacteroidia bacterium]GIV23292.1 MAG: tRNA/rRNA methyltransferase [Bacteroidia bacterium]
MRKLQVEELGRLSVEAYRTAPKLPLRLALDEVRSRYNVGSLLRSADAFRVEKVYLGGFTPAPPHPEIHRSALGAEDSVAWEKVPVLPPLLLQLKKEGWYLLAVEHTDQSHSLWQYRWPQKPLVLILGNELSGISEAVLAVCHEAIEIPQFGTKHSLNVAVAGGIVLYEAARILTGEGPFHTASGLKAPDVPPAPEGPSPQ